MEKARRLAAQGHTGPALDLLSGLLAGPDRVAAASLFAQLVADMRPTAWHPRFAADLLACFDAPIDHQPLARPTAALLLAAADMPGAAPLWNAFLAGCINVDAALESRIAEMRATAAGLTVERRAALALQAFATEYLLPPVSVPNGDPLMAALDRAPAPDARAALLAIGEPLADLLVARAIDAPAAERVLAGAIPALGDDDATSALVRAQYEAAPYPRWQAPPAPARQSLSAALGTRVRSVLVAGCGTGYEAIDLARTDPDIRVVAVDLSAASLAYAQRMAGELGVAIDFRRGDLLRLEAQEGQYDLVTATGVLHHLAEPLAGLRALAAVVRAGGLVRIALYSARARASVAAAHRTIAAHGWSTALPDLRAFRAHVLAARPNDPLAPLATSDDFYAASGVRDLCFHAREHWYTLPEAGAMAAAAGLTLVGIDAPPSARAAFGGGDPLDLARWDAIEMRMPELFAGMYQLWCRAP